MASIAQNNQFKKTTIWLMLAFCIAAGSFLRLWNLGRASLWVDETNALFAAKSWIQDGSFMFPSGYNYTRAPLYTVLTGLCFKGFGVSEASTRLTAALFGILSILLAFVLAKKMFGVRTGLLTAFFMAFSHFEVGWSRTAKMYTLLQFLSLVMMYAFIRGFESDSVSSARKKSPRLNRFLDSRGISPVWLLAALVVFAYTAASVHSLVLFIPAGIVFYWISLAFIRWRAAKGNERFLNKYSIAAVVGLGIALAAWIGFPGLRQNIRYFFTYTAAWAQGESSAQNRMVLFEFLISPQRFPLAAFFFIGAVMTVSRFRRLGWLGICVFLTTLFSLSFVFTHRTPTYLFFVYPLFLSTAAFGFVSFLEKEVSVLGRKIVPVKNWIKAGLVIAAFSVFLFSPWLRITLHIPFLPDGITNLAVTPEEWREASRTVLEQKQRDDLVITSLPQVALYYGLKSDYGLNQANLALTKYEGFFTKDGRRADIYAGVACIENLEELKRLLQSHPSGWLIVSAFHLENDNYISDDVRAFIQNRFAAPFQTANGTVLIYRWKNGS